MGRATTRTTTQRVISDLTTFHCSKLLRVSLSMATATTTTITITATIEVTRSA